MYCRMSNYILSAAPCAIRCSTAFRMILDFAIPKDAIQIARRAANALHADFYVLDESLISPVSFSPLITAAHILDFAAFRGSDLEADLRGRDFTINAIVFDLRNQTILDPLGGASDLRGEINPRLLGYFTQR